MPYAGNNKISTQRFDDSIEISEEEYQHAISQIHLGKQVSVENGKMQFITPDLKSEFTRKKVRKTTPNRPHLNKKLNLSHKGDEKEYKQAISMLNITLDQNKEHNDTILNLSRQREILKEKHFSAERYRRWINCSFVFQSIRQIYFNILYLSKIDIKIIYQESLAPSKILLLHSHELEEQVYLSQMWVLGAFEVVRTIDQWNREGNYFSSKTHIPIKNIKKKLELVRVPLTKLEAPHRAPSQLSTILPARHPELGMSWLVDFDPDVWISRRELSDQMLETFELF
jgi:hypothetical protein